MQEDYRIVVEGRTVKQPELVLRVYCAGHEIHSRLALPNESEAVLQAEGEILVAADRAQRFPKKS
jgi:hypothetical protein